MKKRYATMKVPLGFLVIDRRTRSWVLLASMHAGARVLDYGTCAARPEYVHYLPGRASTERVEVL